MRCHVCSESLSRRLDLSTSVVCRSCAQVMLQNMTPQTLCDLGSQRDEREPDRTPTFYTELRQFRGVF